MLRHIYEKVFSLHLNFPPWSAASVSIFWSSTFSGLCGEDERSGWPKSACSKLAKLAWSKSAVSKFAKLVSDAKKDKLKDKLLISHTFHRAPVTLERERNMFRKK